MIVVVLPSGPNDFDKATVIVEKTSLTNSSNEFFGIILLWV
jgi:hypothetical protein